MTTARKVCTLDARNAIDAWLTVRGWGRDPRASRRVMLSPCGQRRATLGSRCVVFEVGGRGKWRKDMSMHTDFVALTLVTYAGQLACDTRCGSPQDRATTPTPITTPPGFDPWLGSWA